MEGQGRGNIADISHLLSVADRGSRDWLSHHAKIFLKTLNVNSQRGEGEGARHERVEMERKRVLHRDRGWMRDPSNVSAASSNPGLLRLNVVFALITQPTTANNQRRPHTPMSGPWTCHPWVTHSSTPARRASPSGVALSTVPAKPTAAGQANRPSAWVSHPFLGWELRRKEVGRH